MKIIKYLLTCGNISKQEYILNLILFSTLIIIGSTLEIDWFYKISNHSTILLFSFILLALTSIALLLNHKTNKAEKVKELALTQAEEIAEIRRLAEFGKLSSGLFHDLVNPLTAVILNIEKVINDCHCNNLDKLSDDLNQIAHISNRMGQFIKAVRKQIKPNGISELFCLNQEIEEAILVLNYKSKKEQVVIIFTSTKKMYLNNDSIKFSQVISNLISNAIDSYENSNNEHREVLVNLSELNNNLTITVKDSGQGIKPIIIKEIFEPFFSTKKNKNNLGLGLSLIKNIIETDFKGDILVKSEEGQGSLFTVKLPEVIINT